MQVQDYDTLLYRPLLEAPQYDGLIPNSNCQVVLVGDGNTRYSIEQMAATVYKYHHHMAKIAPLLAGNTLQETCTNIQFFCFNHFQYKIDKELQLLRSPACAWNVRYEGIDCKTFSIVASSILMQLGVKHYIRRVKQVAEKPDKWSHVYVVVPLNQETADLSQGYFNIDGLVKIPQPIINEKDDIYMEHHVLAGTSPKGLGFSLSELGLPKIDLNDFKNGGLKGFLNKISCIGGSGYDQNELENNITIITDFFNGLTSNINQAVINNNMEQLKTLTTMFRGSANLFYLCYYEKRYKDNNWNSCTDQRLEATIAVCNFYRTKCVQALDAWLNNYFSKTHAGTQEFISEKKNGNTIEKKMGLDWSHTGATVRYNATIYNYTPKAQSIPAFELNSYVVNSSGFNPFQFLETLTKTIGDFAPKNSNTTTTTNNSGKTNSGSLLSNSNKGNGKVLFMNPTTTTTTTTDSKKNLAGGIVVGILALGVIGTAIYKFGNMPDKPVKAKSQQK